MEAYGEGAYGVDGDEGGQAAAVGGGADEDVVQACGGRTPVSGAVVAGTRACGERGGEQHLPGGGAQPFLDGPAGGVGRPLRHVPPPADLVAGQAERDQYLARGGRAAAGEGVQCLAEQVVAVGEGAALGHEQAGAGAAGAGRGPAAVAAGGAAAPRPAVPAQQGPEDCGVDVGGRGEAAAVGVDGVRPHRSQRLVEGAVRHGLPPVPTRVMISHRARSSKMREVGIRTVVRCRPVTGWPARLTQ